MKQSCRIEMPVWHNGEYSSAQINVMNVDDKIRIIRQKNDANENERAVGENEKKAEH